MRNEELGRLGVASVIAGIAALVLSNSQFCVPSSETEGHLVGGFKAVLYWWLIFVIGAGITLDATLGSTRKTLLLSSIVVAIAFLSAGYFLLTLDTSDQFCFSGFSKSHPAFQKIIVFVFAITVFAVFLLSFSKPIFTKIARAAANKKTPKVIAQIEKTIRALITLLVAIILLLGLK